MYELCIYGCMFYMHNYKSLCINASHILLIFDRIPGVSDAAAVSATAAVTAVRSYTGHVLRRSRCGNKCTSVSRT